MRVSDKHTQALDNSSDDTAKLSENRTV